MCDTLLKFLISVVTFVLGALVAMAQQFYLHKRDIQKEKFFGLYRPFIRFHQYGYCIDANVEFSEFSDAKKDEIIALLRDKDYLATKEIQVLIYSLIKFSYCSDDSDDSDDTEIEHLNAAFNALYCAIWNEYSSLCEKLNYVPFVSL